MARDFLLELGTEEIPSGYIPRAREELASRAAAWLRETGIEHGAVRAWATPRRFVLRVDALGERQPDRRREVTGPPVRAGYDAQGHPTKALTGFARSQGVDIADVKRVQTPKGEYLAVTVTDVGRDVRELLREEVPVLLGGLTFPKSMRWEAPGVRFARPARWLLALYGGEVVPIEFAGLRAGRVTRGHRFVAPAPVEVADVDAYVGTLREAGVVVDQEERRRLVAEGAVRCAASAGGRPREDEELLTTVSNLVELPLPLLAGFDRKYLELPPEVVVTALREHQRYVCVEDAQDRLLPHFVVVGNGLPAIENAVRRGAEKVVAARLEDARFYWNEDRRRPLADRVKDLARVVWQEELGTLGEKTERLVAVAGAVAREVAPESAETAARAALLAKADLTTEMIKDGKEFTSLQGVMGEAYARSAGEPDAVARAIYEHYLPRFAGDRLPQTPAGAAVSVADKTDTVIGCLAVGLGPTGAGDPFGLRRQAQGVVNILADRGWELPLTRLVDASLDAYGGRLAPKRAAARGEALDFFAQRVNFWLEGEGLGGEVARAVLAAEPHRVMEARRRAAALARFRADPDFTALAIGFKRVRNILKGVGETPPLDRSIMREAAEKELAEATARAREEVAPLLAAGRHREVLERMVALRPVIDAFFDAVMVMDEDAAQRNNRLALLKELSALFLQYADFSLMVIPGDARTGDAQGDA